MFRVSELFYSIQGEGFLAGTPAVFIRLQGCPVGCEFCDTKHTWSSRGDAKVDAAVILEDLPREKDAWADIDQNSLLNWVGARLGVDGLVVITGGEPLLHVRLVELVSELLRVYKVQIETSGTVQNEPILEKCQEQAEHPLWLTVSPKWEGKIPVLLQVLHAAHEVKVVISSEEVAQRVRALALPDDLTLDNALLFVQPETGERFEWSLARCVEICKEFPARVRLSTQLHTLLNLR